MKKLFLALSILFIAHNAEAQVKQAEKDAVCEIKGVIKKKASVDWADHQHSPPVLRQSPGYIVTVNSMKGTKASAMGFGTWGGTVESNNWMHAPMPGANAFSGSGSSANDKDLSINAPYCKLEEKNKEMKFRFCADNQRSVTLLQEQQVKMTVRIFDKCILDVQY